jgi:hypothetical protein
MSTLEARHSILPTVQPCELITVPSLRLSSRQLTLERSTLASLCSMLGIRRPMLDIVTLGARRLTLNFANSSPFHHLPVLSTVDVGTLDARCPMPDTRHSAFGARCSTLDARRSTQEPQTTDFVGERSCRAKRRKVRVDASRPGPFNGDTRSLGPSSHRHKADSQSVDS